MCTVVFGCVVVPGVCCMEVVLGVCSSIRCVCWCCVEVVVVGGVNTTGWC